MYNVDSDQSNADWLRARSWDLPTDPSLFLASIGGTSKLDHFLTLPAALQMPKDLLEKLTTSLEKSNPNVDLQPRDDHGKWVSTGGVSQIDVLGDASITPKMRANLDKWKTAHKITEKRLLNNARRLLKEATKEQRREGMLWYDRAHAYAVELAKKYDTSVERQVAIIAALSPQAQWPVNKRVAAAVGERMSKKDFAFTEANLAERMDSLEKSLSMSTLNTRQKDQIRSESRDFYTSYLGTRPTNSISSGDLAKLISAPGLYDFKEKAIELWRGAGIDETLGGFKVRSFYNNIVDPKGSKSVTIDSHALRGLLNDRETSNAFAAGIFSRPARYELFARTYQTLGRQHGIRPNQAQAIAWIVWRSKNP